MRLLRFGEAGHEHPGLLDSGNRIRDLSKHLDDFDRTAFVPEVLDRLATLDPTSLPLVEEPVRLGPPISAPGHFIGIGLNYSDHALEAGLDIPGEPIVFSKAPSCICGPNDHVLIPEGSTTLDWEIELAVVMSRPAFRVSEEEALAHVAGYTICNDVSERTWQLRGTGQWGKGKSAPTFGPLGPAIVTCDEVPDPQDLSMELLLNGRPQQTGHSGKMIFTVGKIISYLSHLMLLEPGDVITTGTPPGVGMGAKPPVYLKDGDEMVLRIEGLGAQCQKAVAA
ncbi:fumarylacetoacetate hydrolase family protein [Roseibium sp. RKSG952]|uniref:fumarylacetoacetate hydrolase family protein n=1 Tax=Roseibium sp. RKSG952 TaxID=2529384 RepID=UPI0012BCE4D3|nr:fumarylacetoacetate hydrolase family protein [Roseibium sp. RKSG952]MTH97788.1 FAA hydrolase family protein [Roseibium sp. RKSG952]